MNFKFEDKLSQKQKIKLPEIWQHWNSKTITSSRKSSSNFVYKRKDSRKKNGIRVIVWQSFFIKLTDHSHTFPSSVVKTYILATNVFTITNEKGQAHLKQCQHTTNDQSVSRKRFLENFQFLLRIKIHSPVVSSII